MATITSETVGQFLSKHYPDSGISVVSTAGPAIASLVLPSDVADIGSFLAVLRSELGVVCDARVGPNGAPVFDVWPVPRAASAGLLPVYCRARTTAAYVLYTVALVAILVLVFSLAAKPYGTKH